MRQALVRESGGMQQARLALAAMTCLRHTHPPPLASASEAEGAHARAQERLVLAVRSAAEAQAAEDGDSEGCDSEVAECWVQVRALLKNRR